MTYIILIVLCVVVIMSYLFEVTGKHSRIPGVILLIITGIAFKYICVYFNISIPGLPLLLPIMGTLGLILIVLEGSLDLSINKEKKVLIIKSIASAIILFVLFVAVFTYFLVYLFNYPVHESVLNAIPFGIISSAVAIPSTSSMGKDDKEFVVYESSISDIIGIIAFDFVLYNREPLNNGLLRFSYEALAMVLLSVVFGIGLAYLLHKIKHHVKYVVILTSVVLLFSLSKLIHWPSLLVVLIFGLIMNNNYIFQNKYTLKVIDFNDFNNNLKSFKHITGELTFLVRSFFFIIFGFYTNILDVLNPVNLFFSVVIFFLIFILRFLFFKLVIFKPLNPLWFFAPRGLITILLFLSIPNNMKLSVMSEGLVVQTIFISILFMTFGSLIYRKVKE